MALTSLTQIQEFLICFSHYIIVTTITLLMYILTAQRQATLLAAVSYVKITLLVTVCPIVFCVFNWILTISPGKFDVILTCLRIGHSMLIHRHLLLAEDKRTCSHCHSSALTICHLLIDYLGLCNMFRKYFHSSSPSLTDLLGENPHKELLNFL